MRTHYKKNISDVLKKTFDNRAEGIRELADVRAALVIRYDRRSEPEAWETYKGDPFLKLNKTLTVPIKVEDKDSRGQVTGVRDEEYVMNFTPLFSKTSKMTAGSFSLPAGPMDKETNGTCPASNLPTGYTRHQDIPESEVDERSLRPAEQICRKCYSNKGNYMHRPSQYGQVLRLRFIREKMRELGPKGLSVIMIEALTVHSQNTKKRAADGEDPRFFRIHDSGDLFHEDIYKMWWHVCMGMPDINFWCPTRQWVFPKFTDLFRSIPLPPNLALRPSAYHFEDVAPEIAGVSSGTSSHYEDTDPIAKEIADWPCPAYAEGAGTCAGALERAARVWKGNAASALKDLKMGMSAEEKSLTNGGHDCRVCWLKKDFSVSYKAH